MPLKASTNPNVDTSDLFNIRFPMMDAQKVIAVRVSSNALEDRAARDGVRGADIVDVFNSYRNEVEAAAIRKYDPTVHKPGTDLTIISADLD